MSLDAGRRALADVVAERPFMRAALGIAKEVYAGTGGRADNDADILRDLANFLDRIDNLTDLAYQELWHSKRVDRAMQADLRRIADRLDAIPPTSPSHPSNHMKNETDISPGHDGRVE